MTRWPGLFPVVYEQSSGGLVLAEQELARLVERHAAHASQPNITAIWQGYIDQKADSVAKQTAVVERLRAVVRVQFAAEAGVAAGRM
jgi:hypothetical protein